MNKISLSLPYPPSVNHYWRFSARGGKPCWYICSEGQNFRRAVWAELKLRHAAHKAFMSDVKLVAWIHPPDRRKRDLDNVLKAIRDSLQSAGVYAKDSQFSKYHVERWDGGKGHV